LALNKPWAPLLNHFLEYIHEICLPMIMKRGFFCKCSFLISFLDYFNDPSAMLGLANFSLQDIIIMYVKIYIITNIYMYVKIQKNVGITEFRQKLASYFKQVIEGNPVVVSNDNIQAVLIDLDTYNSLVQAYEDKVDSEKLVKSVIKNKGKKNIAWESLKKKTR
jgi:prevent-host-death family protein